MAERLSFDDQGRVISIQRFEIDAPGFQPQSGDAERWMEAYWSTVAVFTLGLLTTRRDEKGLTILLRWFGIPLFQFAPPWFLETEDFVCWELALQSGLLIGKAGGYFVCAAERRSGDRWYFTMVLRGFTSRIAGLRPVLVWKPIYGYTQALIHHLIGVVYLWRRGQILQAVEVATGQQS